MAVRASVWADIGVVFRAKKKTLNCHPEDDSVVVGPAGVEEDVADGGGAGVARRAEVHQGRVDRRLQQIIANRTEHLQGSRYFVGRRSCVLASF